MKRIEMVCNACLGYSLTSCLNDEDEFVQREPSCRLNPTPGLFSNSGLDPATHWCMQGVWRETVPCVGTQLRYWTHLCEGEGDKSGDFDDPTA